LLKVDNERNRKHLNDELKDVHQQHHNLNDQYTKAAKENSDMIAILKEKDQVRETMKKKSFNCKSFVFKALPCHTVHKETGDGCEQNESEDGKRIKRKTGCFGQTQKS
jgi:hypothetical protein